MGLEKKLQNMTLEGLGNYISQQNNRVIGMLVALPLVTAVDAYLLAEWAVPERIYPGRDFAALYVGCYVITLVPNYLLGVGYAAKKWYNIRRASRKLKEGSKIPKVFD